MKKARMNISHYRFILFNLKIFGEILVVTTIQILIVSKQLQLFHSYATKIWLVYVSESRTLCY